MDKRVEKVPWTLNHTCLWYRHDPFISFISLVPGRMMLDQQTVWIASVDSLPVCLSPSHNQTHTGRPSSPVAVMSTASHVQLSSTILKTFFLYGKIESVCMSRYSCVAQPYTRRAVKGWYPPPSVLVSTTNFGYFPFSKDGECTSRPSCNGKHLLSPLTLPHTLVSFKNNPWQTRLHQFNDSVPNFDLCWSPRVGERLNGWADNVLDSWWLQRC